MVSFFSIFWLSYRCPGAWVPQHESADEVAVYDWAYFLMRSIVYTSRFVCRCSLREFQGALTKYFILKTLSDFFTISFGTIPQLNAVSPYRLKGEKSESLLNIDQTEFFPVNQASCVSSLDVASCLLFGYILE